MLIIFIVIACISLSIAIANRLLTSTSRRVWASYSHDDSTRLWYSTDHPRTKERAFKGLITKSEKDELPNEPKTTYYN